MRKFLFVGVGSIAKRHIRNIVDIYHDKGETLNIDVVRSGNGKALEPEISCFVRDIYFSSEEVPDDYDAVFITNPTKLHLKTLYEYKNKGRNFFIEKPFVDRSQLEEAQNCIADISGIKYVACPLRYTMVIQYLKSNVKLEDVFSVRAISSSYLPNWRPKTDYRSTYSAHRDMGGGVSIDLIHEWDYIQFLFGKPRNVSCFISKKSNLDIDSDDLAIYIAEYKNMMVELHLDYFGRKTIRQFEIFTKDETIKCDLVNGIISYLSSGKEVSFMEERDDYQKKELEFFVELLEKSEKGAKLPEYNDISCAISTLKLTMGYAK